MNDLQEIIAKQGVIAFNSGIDVERRRVVALIQAVAQDLQSVGVSDVALLLESIIDQIRGTNNNG